MSVGVQLRRPGVYLAPPREPGTFRPVRLDVAGFVGVAPRGPVDTPVATTSWTDYERRFGGFDRPGAPDDGPGPLLPYAVEAFFAQGGEKAWVVRVGAAPDSPGPTGTEATALFSLDPEPGARWSLLAADEGVWGDRLQIEVGFAVERTCTAESVLGADLLLLPRGSTPAEASLCRIRRADLPPAGVLRWITVVPDPARPGRVVRLDTPLPVPPSGSSTRLEVVTATLVVHDPGGGPRTERIRGLGLRAGHPRFLPDVLAEESVLVRAGDGWEPLLPHPLLRPVPATLRRAGRDRSRAVGTESFFDDEPGGDPLDELETHRGVDALVRSATDLAVLTVPDLTWGPSGADGLDARQPDDLAEIVRRQQRLLARADLRRRFVVLLDVPRGLSPEAVTDWRAGFDSGYAAAYHPWLGTPRRVGRQPGASRPPLAMVPPSAYAAGILAARERRLGLTWGPANELARGAVLAVEQPGEALADRLHRLGVNLFLPERDGFRLTSGRTLATDPAYCQLSVRRSMTMLALVLERQTQWLVFEPHTVALRSRLTHSLTHLLRDLHRRGAFAGDTEAESFFVRCDDSTHPAGSVDQGRLVAEVGVAPAAPLEYLVLRITADVDGGVAVTEV